MLRSAGRVGVIVLACLFTLTTLVGALGTLAGTDGQVQQLAVQTPNGLHESRIHSVSVTGFAMSDELVYDTTVGGVIQSLAFGMNTVSNFFKTPERQRANLDRRDGREEVSVSAAVHHYLTTGQYPEGLGVHHPDGHFSAESTQLYKLPESAFDYQVLDRDHVGTSAALARVLAHYDAIHPLNVDGLVVATGSMNPYGGDMVLPVGGIDAKAEAALKAGASLFIYPEEICHSQFAKQWCGKTEYKGMPTVGVKTSREALLLLGAEHPDVLPSLFPVEGSPAPNFSVSDRSVEVFVK